jgi:biotin carboxyl carrier protein
VNLDILRVTVGETWFDIDPSDLDAGTGEIRGALVLPLPSARAEERSGRTRWEVVIDGWRFDVTVESAVRATLRERAAQVGGSSRAQVAETLLAQLPGRIVSVFVSVGDEVAAGQRIVSLEAMKMENEIRATRAGRITRVSVTPGQRVELGDELGVIE